MIYLAPTRTDACLCDEPCENGLTLASFLLQQVNELKNSVDNLERERDFYYSKLREVRPLSPQRSICLML